MRIKNKKKFIRAIFIILGIVIGLNFILISRVFSNQEITYKTVSVVTGDTLWDIAKREEAYNDYYSGTDVRDIIEDIKDVNNLGSSSLSESQVLKIPTY